MDAPAAGRNHRCFGADVDCSRHVVSADGPRIPAALQRRRSQYQYRTATRDFAPGIQPDRPYRGRTLHRTPEVVSTTRRTGRAELDEHAAGVNASEIEVVTRPLNRRQAEVMEEVRQNLAE